MKMDMEKLAQLEQKVLLDIKEKTKERFKESDLNDINAQKQALEVEQEKLQMTIKMTEVEIRLFNANPRLAQAEFEYQLTDEYAELTKEGTILKFNSELVNAKRLLASAQAQLDGINELLEEKVE